jgi:hypothetical protein
LDNIGKEGHTYLHHIINNYNNLANVTIFIPGSIDMPHKKPIIEKIINNVEKTNNTSFVVEKEGEDISNIFDYKA